jgi:hypothetical protein
MNNIKIFDQFLTSDELHKCQQITSESTWKYGHSSTQVGIFTPFWYMELIHNDFLKEVIKRKIENITNKKFKVNRVYANGQTYGQTGQFHQDDTSEKSYTFCLYISPMEEKMIDIVEGYIQFKIPEINPFIVELEPLYNRGILFPSNYFHRGNAFSRYVPNLRICIAWKLEELVIHSIY